MGSTSLLEGRAWLLCSIEEEIVCVESLVPKKLGSEQEFVETQ
jgi:hypothetical protein